MKEMWKPIKGYDGIYEISNLGRIKSLSRQVGGKGGCKYILKERYLKLEETKTGYIKVILSRNWKYKTVLVHRLVAEAFIPNPHNLPCINHKDERKNNNNVDNLEWCTRKYNSNYGTAIQKRVLKQRKKVNLFDLNGKLIKSFSSISEAARETGSFQGNVSGCCHNRRGHKTSKGYIFKFADL
jgi:hypothetical protein